MLPAAACHGVYDLLAGSCTDGLRAEVSARCVRHEAGREATRFQCFEPGPGQAVLAGFGLEVTAEGAHDPFFGAAAALLVAAQQATDAKTELVVDGPGRSGPYEVASVNRHGHHFGKAFAIEAGGAPASSACIAFGIERLLLALAASGSDASRALLDRARVNAAAS